VIRALAGDIIGKVGNYREQRSLDSSQNPRYISIARSEAHAAIPAGWGLAGSCLTGWRLTVDRGGDRGGAAGAGEQDNPKHIEKEEAPWLDSIRQSTGGL
jgi:hypothetical protein